MYVCKKEDRVGCDAAAVLNADAVCRTVAVDSAHPAANGGMYGLGDRGGSTQTRADGPVASMVMMRISIRLLDWNKIAIQAMSTTAINIPTIRIWNWYTVQ